MTKGSILSSLQKYPITPCDTRIVPEPRVRAQSSVSERKSDLIGIGAAVTHRPLPHHRAYGSVHGGSSWLR